MTSCRYKPKQSSDEQDIKSDGSPPVQPSEASSSASSTINLDDIYGDGKLYPEPYFADKVSREILADKQKKRYYPEPFIYSVRFRSAPLGLAFDNKLVDATKVEKLIPRQQAESADIRVGDYLIAVNAVNTSTAPAKISLRIIASAGFPLTLVFESQRHVKNPVYEAERMKLQLHNVSILYPPSLVHDFQVKQANWSGK
jgi:hypothetical protein